MSETTVYLEEVGEIVQALEQLGLEPVLVGGMALVTLGSRRVTEDFDLVISKPDNRIDAMLDVLYDKGFELVSRLDKEGEVRSTIDNRRVASIRLRLDSPDSAHFFNRKTELRIDLLFDFPIPAAELARGAKRTRVHFKTLRVASEDDLIRLKEIANADRHSARDIEDLAFLKARQKDSKKNR